jgi:hypothetical protein
VEMIGSQGGRSELRHRRRNLYGGDVGVHLGAMLGTNVIQSTAYHHRRSHAHEAGFFFLLLTFFRTAVIHSPPSSSYPSRDQVFSLHT